jgi:hypothetical protein
VGGGPGSRLGRRSAIGKARQAVKERARNLEFGAYVLEKARGQGLTGPGDEISDELIADAAEEFFGSADSPEARGAIAYVNDAE